MQNYSNPKSATAAGLLGIFLGSFGAHCWYLGDKKKGIIHISLFAGGVALEILASALVASSVGSALMTGSVGLLALSPILGGIGGLVLAGNSLWGLIEGIIILSHGDAGLAAQGYATAAPAQPQYQQPYQPQPGYQQPYQQPYPAQPEYPQQPDPNAQPAQPAAPQDNGGVYGPQQ